MRMTKASKVAPKRSGASTWLPLILGMSVSIVVWVPHIDAFNVAKFVLLCFGVLILSIASLGQLKSKLSTSFGTYLLIMFVFALLLNLLTSPNMYKTITGTQGRNNGVITYFCFAVLAIFISTRFKFTDIPKLLWSLMTLGIVQTIYMAIQLADVDPVKWNNPYGDLLGTLGNPNFAAALLAICSIATLWLATIYRNVKKYALMLLLAVVMELFIIVKSNVRQALIVFFFGLAVVVFSELSLKSKKLSLVWGALASLVGLFSLLGALQVGPLATFLYKESVTYRGDYWRAAWRMFLDNPIFGVGLGNYGDYFNRYRDATQVARRGPSVGTDAAHNIPLDFLAMGGVVLGIIYISILMYCLYAVTLGSKKSDQIEKQDRYIVFTLLTAYILQSLISIDQIGLAVWGWIFIGVALIFAKERKVIGVMDSQLNRILVPITILVTLISFITVSLPTWKANSELKKLASIPAQIENLDTRAIRLQIAAEIAATNPRDSELKTQIALYLLTNGQSEGIKYAQDAIRQNPSDSTAFRYLIIAFSQLDDAENLKKYKAEALKIDPFNPDLK